MHERASMLRYAYIAYLFIKIRSHYQRFIMNGCAATYVHVCHATKHDSVVKAVMIRCNKSGDRKIGDGNTEN